MDVTIKLFKKKPVVIAVSTVLVAAATVGIVVAVMLTGNGTDAAPVQPTAGPNGDPSGPAAPAVLTKEEYMKARERMVVKDESRALGASIKLTDKETRLDSILLKEKQDFIEKARKGKGRYMPAVGFFKSRDWMKDTKAYKIIKMMPKGAALHLHLPALTSLDWVVKNATYRDDVYMCTDRDGYVFFSPFPATPPDNPDCPWTLVNTNRKAAVSKEEFDENLRRNMSLLATDPLVSFPSVNEVWARFEKYFLQTDILLSYEPIVKDYMYQMLVEFHEDNVQYMEIRTKIEGFITHKDGKVVELPSEWLMDMGRYVNKEFIKAHPDFIGFNWIHSGIRFRPAQDMMREVKETLRLRKDYSDILLGYDLVGQEDPLHTLLFYLDALLYPNSQGKIMPYFFHAAETKFQGTETDQNLYDALLLNTTRIGHGYALAKHPEMTEEVKRRQIPVEINPISNQLLGLVSDLRNHAMIPLLADDFPLVISSDDPAVWESAPLSHDFLVAFMDMCGENMGLAFLKQLAINSIKFSALDDARKTKLMELWESKWETFVDDALAQFGA